MCLEDQRRLYYFKKNILNLTKHTFNTITNIPNNSEAQTYFIFGK